MNFALKLIFLLILISSTNEVSVNLIEYCIDNMELKHCSPVMDETNLLWDLWVVLDNYFEVETFTPCINLGFHFHWLIKDIESDKVVKEFKEFKYRSILLIPANSMVMGEYLLELTIGHKVTEIDKAFQCFVKFQPIHVIAVITGAIKRSIHSGDIVKLDGSYSYDGGYPAVTYEWEAIRELEDATKIMETGKIVHLKFDGEPGQQWRVKLTVGAGTSSDVKTHTFTIAQQSVPVIDILCKQNCPTAGNYFVRKFITTSLEVLCFKNCNKIAKFQWTVDDADNVDTMHAHGPKDSRMSVKFFQLPEGDNSDVTLSVEAYDNSGQKLVSAVNSLPSLDEESGNIDCLDYDEEGMELMSVIHIKCTLKSRAIVHYKIVQYIDPNTELTIMKSVAPDFNVRLSAESDPTVILMAETVKMRTKEGIQPDISVSSDYPKRYSNAKSIVEDMYSDRQLEASLCPSPTKLGQEGRVWEAVQVINALMPKLIKEETDDESRRFNIDFTTRLYKDILLFPTELALDSLILILYRLMRPIEEPKLMDNALALSRLCRHLATKRREDIKQNALLYELIIIPEYHILKQCAHYLMDSNYYKDSVIDVSTPPPMENHPVIEEDYPSYGEIMTESMRDQFVKITNNSIAIAQLASQIRIITWPYGELELSLGDAYFQPDRASFIKRQIKVERCQIDLPQNIGFEPNENLRLLVNIFNESLFFWAESDLVVNTVIATLVIIDSNGQELYKLPEIADVYLHTSRPVETIYHDENTSLPAGQSEYNDTNIPVYRIDMKNDSHLQLFIRNFTQALNVVILNGRRPTFEDFQHSELITGNEHRIDVPRNNYDTWMYLGVLPASAVSEMRGNPSLLEMKDNNITKNEESPNSSTTFQLSVLTQECVEWKDNIWFQTDCKIGDKSNVTLVHCQCYSIRNVAAFSKNPNYTRRDLITISFTLEYNSNLIPTILIIGIMLVCCTAMIFNVCRGSIKQQIYYLGDNLPKDNYAYLIQTRTNSKLNAGTTSNICIKIYGKNAKSRAHILNYPDPDKNLLQSGNEDYFILTTRRHLGDLKTIDLWSDCLDIRPTWICDTIQICDLQKRVWYAFEVENIFLPINNYKHNVTVKVDDIEKRKNKLTFKGIIKRFKMRFGAGHTWNIFSRTDDASFRYVERITVIYATIMSTCAISMLICICPLFTLIDNIYDNGVIQFMEIFKYSLMTCLVPFIISMAAVLIFRNLIRKEESRFFYCKKRFPEKLKHITWVILCLTIIISTVYVLWMGSGIPLQATYIWLIVATASLFMNIVFFENIFLAIIDLITWHRPNIIYRYGNIVTESQCQKVYLKHIVPGAYSLRPYLVHLYKPMNPDRYERKRHEIAERFLISQTFKDFIAFLIYFFFLYALIMVDLNDHRTILNEHMTEMVIGETEGILLLEVKNSEQLIMYLNDTLSPTLYAYTWYGDYSSNDPGLTLDFQTKLLGIARIRQKRIIATDCLDKTLSAQIFAITKCLPLYSSKYENTISWEEKRSLWKYNSAHENGETINFGELGTYFGSGYITHIGRKLSNAYFMINEIIEEKWLDKQTRAVFIEFWAYNANKNLFSIVTVMFEFYPTGYIEKTYDIYTLTLMYTDPRDQMVTVIVFVLYCVLVLNQVGTVISKMVRHGRHFWTRQFSYLDLAIILGNVILVGIFLHKQIVVENVLDELDRQKKNKFTIYFGAIFYDDLITIYIAILMTVSLLGTWRFLRFGLMFKIFERAIRKQTNPLLSALIYSFVIYMQYFVISYTLFHSYTRIFQGVGSALTVISFLGLEQYKGYDHEELQNMLPLVSRLFYSFYRVSVLIFINVYIAIITLHYEDARSYIIGQKKHYNILTYFKEELKYFMTFINRRKRFLIGGRDCTSHDSKKRLTTRYMKKRSVSKKNEDDEQASGIIYIHHNKLQLISIVILASIWNKLLKKDTRSISKHDYLLMQSLAYYIKYQNTGDCIAYFPMKVENGEQFHYMPASDLDKMEILANELFNQEEQEIKPKSEMRDNTSLSRLKIIARKLKYADTVIQNINVKRMRGGRIMSVESF